MSYDTIELLRSQLGAVEAPAVDPVYAAKMLHALPAATQVDRAAFILERVAGKRVLEFGASGPMHDAIVKAAVHVAGVDRPGLAGVTSLSDRAYAGVIGDGVFGFDLDDVASTGLPQTPSPPDVIVCGEILEHLSNPGWFLTRLRRQYAGVPVIVTVPNAFTDVSRSHLSRGVENVNKEHVCWYSPTTLRTLLKRHGYRIAAFHYYGGSGPTAQGLVVVTESDDGTA